MNKPGIGRIAALAFFASCAVHPAANAAVADFDSLSEGFYGTVLIDGGIRFYDPDWYIPGEQTVIAIDRADVNLGDDPFFSSPNGMGMGGLVPGGNGGGSRFGSIRFELADGGRGDGASVDVWFNQLDPGNRLVLAAFFGGAPVAATSVVGPINCCDVHERLELTGVVFDSLRLFGIGPIENGAAFMLVDNVTIDGVPLPAGFWLLGSACAALARFAPAVSRGARRAAAR